jgi:hypothetical protein
MALKPGRGVARTAARIAPWAIAAAILFVLFRNIDPSDVVRGFEQAAGWTVPVLVGLFVLLFLADGFAAWKTFSWFCAPIGYGETLLVRGAAYPLSLVNYTVGQGAFAFFLHRTRDVPLLRCTATVLLVMGINLLALLLLATLGLRAGRDVPQALGAVLVVAYIGLAIYALLLAIKPGWLASRPIFDVLLQAGLGGHLRTLAVRLPHVALLVAVSFLNLRAFGVEVPLVQALLLLPVVYFVAVLPISVQGLGTSQAMMVLLFERFVPGGVANPKSLVLAASLAGQIITIGVQLLIGIICLRTPLGRSLFRTEPASEP